MKKPNIKKTIDELNDFNNVQVIAPIYLVYTIILLYQVLIAYPIWFVVSRFERSFKGV